MQIKYKCKFSDALWEKSVIFYWKNSKYRNYIRLKSCSQFGQKRFGKKV